jgi:glycosyltransferase involved in cell wall biosynthesis
MSQIKLSYILSTYNKLPYLKIVMDSLLKNVQEDEEIVITDGGSTDGTFDYLQDLLEQGKIQQFVSEKDKGEGHGYNKAFLMARGDLIKLIFADDIFYYPAIRSCRIFMEKNPSVDLMTGMAAMVDLGNGTSIYPINDFFEEFQKWQTGTYERFYSNGQSLLIRRSSLPLMGLFNNDLVYVDAEYTLRVSKTANAAFCNQCIAVRVTNLDSKAISNSHGRAETISLFNFYNHPIPATWQESKKDKMPTLLRMRIYLSQIKKRMQGLPPFQPAVQSRFKHLDYNQMVDFYKQYAKELEALNQNIEIRFYHK